MKRTKIVKNGSLTADALNVQTSRLSTENREAHANLKRKADSNQRVRGSDLASVVSIAEENRNG